jgi:hypothetical protein
MSLATMLSGAVLDTILARLTVLFLTGSGGDLAAAHHGAAKMLAGYHPETEDELRLAAEIVSFGFHALEALSQAASHDLPLTKILRLRGSAVSLSRQSHRSQHRLDQLQTRPPHQPRGPTRRGPAARTSRTAGIRAAARTPRAAAILAAARAPGAPGILVASGIRATGITLLAAGTAGTRTLPPAGRHRHPPDRDHPDKRGHGKQQLQDLDQIVSATANRQAHRREPEKEPSSPSGLAPTIA